jgi:membrane protease YdiL (CAAX protease family)
VLWLAGTVASEFVPLVLLGLPLQGGTFALVGLLRALTGPPAVALALRLAKTGLRDVGLTAAGWRRDALAGAAVAVPFTLLQFLVVIPATGGAGRSDVAANATQIGGSLAGVAGFVVLAWTGAFSEELFFRGHVVTLLRRLLGDSSAALAGTVVLTSVIFGAGHGYQGWAGVVDTGLYGGLVLTLVYLWRGRLTACIVAHALWNTLATVAIYAGVLPAAAPFPER